MRDAGAGWTNQSEIVTAYSIYLPGIETPSYYEFKVKTGDEDAGFILVNANETDIRIPELSTDGLTLTETYRQTLGSRDFQLYRYGWFSSAAQAVDRDRAFLASMGISDSSATVKRHSPLASRRSPLSGRTGRMGSRRQDLSRQLGSYHELYADEVQRRKTAPFCIPAGIKQYYEPGSPRERLRGPASRVRKIGGPMSLLSSPSPKFHLTAFQRHHGHELAYDIGGWHTPAWHQTWHLRTYEGGGSGQSPVGCGNTAWTMLYAYWDQFKGKTGLFETDLETIWHPADRSVLPGTEIDSVMWHIAGLTNTSHGRFRWSWEQEWGEYGRTTPANMRRGSRYAYEKGYPATSVTRLRGPERTKWDMIDAEIAADRPVILLINNYGNTNYGLIPTHYVIVERTLLIEERGLDDYGYHVNWGHGAGAEQPHKWLWTAGTGLDDSAFSAFLVRMRTDLMIAVDGVLGTDAITLPVESNDPQQLTFHVANLRDQDTARVQVTVEQAGGRTYVPTGGTLSVQEGEQRTFPVGRPKSVTLLAQCGSQSVSTKVFFDYAPPTFESVGVSLHEDSVVLTAYGMYDDGQWDNSDYQTMVTLTQGSSQAAYPPRAGKSATLYGLPPGTHTGQMRIMDGCGRVSEPRPFEFTVGTTAPIVSFVSPPEGAGVRRNTAATVTIRAGDMDDGIKEVVIYRDQVFSGDLDSTRLHRFGQSDFTTGRVEEKSCSIRFDMTPGEHKLIAVAEDHSRRTTTVERTIRVVEP